MDADAFSALRLLEQIQLDNGGFPAATVENLSTGDGWGYNQDTTLLPLPGLLWLWIIFRRLFS
jgi:hypothetical protein